VHLAVKEFMPQDNGMAFVIILHLSPDHESIADKIIQESTQMPVMQVTETVPIEKNRVYVISPAQWLTINDGFLEVSTPESRESRHASIDLFFRDLANVHRERAFCVVLSGTGSDGGDRVAPDRAADAGHSPAGSACLLPLSAKQSRRNQGAAGGHADRRDQLLP
jgi:chemotaxis response regulator CheB